MILSSSCPFWEGSTVEVVSPTRTVPSSRNDGHSREAEHSSFLIPITEVLHTMGHRNCVIRLLAIMRFPDSLWIYSSNTLKTALCFLVIFHLKSVCVGEKVFIIMTIRLKGNTVRRYILPFFAVVPREFQNCCYDHIGCF